MNRVYRALSYPIMVEGSWNCEFLYYSDGKMSYPNPSSPAPLTILRELRQRRPDLLESKDFHVFIDGGVRRGTDVLKALCLGAKGVGLGRPFLYANSVWGEEGVRRAIQSK
jgi:hypothetical protein